MSLRSRVGGVVMGMSLVIALGILPSLGQDPAKEDGEAAASRASRRVPPYFSKAGISAEQKEKIYAVRAKHQITIAALKKQLDDAEAKELTDCESVLTAAQKKLLDEYRAEAKAKAKSAPRPSAPKVRRPRARPKSERESAPSICLDDPRRRLDAPIRRHPTFFHWLAARSSDIMRSRTRRGGSTKTPGRTKGG